MSFFSPPEAFLKTEVEDSRVGSTGEKGFFSALQTSGSFVMMQAGGFLFMQK